MDMDLTNIFQSQEVLQTGSAFVIVFYVLQVVAMWKIFEKAGEAGWKSLIPLYNLYILLKIIRFNWLLLLGLLIFIIPILGWAIGAIYLVVLQVIVCYRLARSFGKELGYMLGLIFLTPIFYLMLGFGDAKYKALRD